MRWALAGFGVVLVASASMSNGWAGVRSYTPIGPGGGCINAVAVDPRSADVAYVATGICPLGTHRPGTGGLFKTEDGGESWRILSRGIDFPNLYAVAIDPAQPDTLLVAGVTGVYKSIDAGRHWRLVASGDRPFRSLAFDPRNTSTVYAGTVGAVMRSGDGGETWTSFELPLYPAHIAVDPNQSSVVYAVQNVFGLLRGDDRGRTTSPAAPSSTSTASCSRRPRRASAAPPARSRARRRQPANTPTRRWPIGASRPMRSGGCEKRRRLHDRTYAPLLRASPSFGNQRGTFWQYSS